MGILTRYLLRAHLGPFIFAFTLLTGLLFVNAIAQRLQRLVGKGLPVDIIVDFVLLALPHTIALTLPLGVLVAVLYAFSDMSANSEVIAMSAGGVRPRRLLVPVLTAATALAVITYLFNDQVLPEANHALKNLSITIGQKNPTFQLRERVVNKIDAEEGAGPYFLQAQRIDNQTSEMEDIVIYDLSEPGRRQTTYASRGTMAMNAAGTDLTLRLEDGRAFEVGGERSGAFQHTTFDRQVIVLRGVGDILEIHEGDQRSDREMSVAMLLEQAKTKRVELASVREDGRIKARRAVERALGRVEADTASGPTTETVLSASLGLPNDAMTQSVAVTTRTSANRVRALQRQVNKHEVELHKKFTISFACIVFVLIGAPIGIRFPNGGVGMVIAVSTAVIAIYWMGMIGGEKIADEGLANPFWIMWAPNFVFTIAGILMVRRMGNWVASARSSGWRDLWANAFGRLIRIFPKRPIRNPTHVRA